MFGRLKEPRPPGRGGAPFLIPSVNDNACQGMYCCAGSHVLHLHCRTQSREMSHASGARFPSAKTLIKYLTGKKLWMDAGTTIFHVLKIAAPSGPGTYCIGLLASLVVRCSDESPLCAVHTSGSLIRIWSCRARTVRRTAVLWPAQFGCMYSGGTPLDRNRCQPNKNRVNFIRKITSPGSHMGRGLSWTCHFLCLR